MSVLCHCDNEAVVLVNTGTCKDPIAVGLMHCLYFIVAKFKLLISVSHLAGSLNTHADALSRNNASHFYLPFHMPSVRAPPFQQH